MAVSSEAIRTKRRTRRFYIGMAVAMAVTVFAGFSRSYFLKAHFGTPELSLLLLVFTSWVLLFLSQITLVGSGPGPTVRLSARGAVG
jgi:undecaprenyl pyrophosphate phosphatase UppP